jgi:hypothetical protein
MQRRGAGLSILGVIAALLVPFLQGAEIGSGGRQLLVFLDSLQVEQRWIAGAHVNWRTGEPDGKSVSATGAHSHCSALVAAACEKLGVYILRPPEHSQTLLANAQYDWLIEHGAEEGWIPVRGAAEAQNDANRGMLVVAAYRNSRTREPGHIAIVRPSDRSEKSVRDDGPQVFQAGQENYASAPLKVGFRHHPDAWKREEVRFFTHEILWARQAGGER